jgi:hypothetical protein
MARVMGSVVIDRPVDEVFDVVADQTIQPGTTQRLEWTRS